MRRVERIVLIGLSNVGDGVLMAPVIQRLHARYPDAFLTLFAGERAQVLFEHDPRVHQVVCTDEYRGAAGRLRLVGELRRARPDLVIDLRHTLLPLFWRPWRAGRYLARPPLTLSHMRERHLWKLEQQDPNSRRSPQSTVDGPQSALWISEEEAARADRLLERWQVPAGRRLVLICPGARSHIKRWDAGRFAQVADRLIAEQSVEVAFTGEPEEAPLVQEILKAMRRPGHDATSCTTVPQLAALMRRAALVLTNDSASLHVASAVGVPTVAIFGPTDERKYGPTSPQHRVVRRQLFCTPCEAAQCRYSHECMRFVSAEEVFDAAAALLSAPQPTAAPAPRPRPRARRR